MARVIFSGLVDSMAGRLAGSVIQTTVGGFQIRTKVSPRNPRSGLQQSSRSHYGYFMQSWQHLTQLQRDSWINNAPSGIPPASFYAERNQMIHSAGGAQLNAFTPGTAPTLNTLDFQTLDTSQVIVALTASFGTVPANNYIVILTTNQFTQGLTFISPSAYSPLTTLPPGTSLAVDHDITAAYTARYGATKEAYLIGVAAYTIDISTGVASNRLSASSYIQP